MGKRMKVARWEIKRNLQNKTFIISTFMTPAFFLFFVFIGGMMGGDDEITEPVGSGAEQEQTELLMIAEVDAFEAYTAAAQSHQLPYEFTRYDGEATELYAEAEEEEIAYLVVGEQDVALYASEDFGVMPMQLQNDMEFLTQAVQLEAIGVNTEEADEVLTESAVAVSIVASSGGDDEFFSELVPALFAGVVLLSIVITGMMTFNSSMQEKKDKMAETLLSSVTPNELMQGKIFGYFVVGMAQVTLWIVIGVPVAQFYADIPVLENIVTPLTLLFLLYAVLGYLLFASMYVALGATIEDATTASNFTGIFMMLPFLPFPFIWAFVSDPGGLIATIASYFPFTTSAAMIVRIVALDTFPLVEVILSLAVLVLSVWVMMNIAGKVYKTGMLMYGKNATPGEILKWIRQ